MGGVCVVEYFNFVDVVDYCGGCLFDCVVVLLCLVDWGELVGYGVFVVWD